MKTMILILFTLFANTFVQETDCLALQYRAIQHFKDLSQHKFIKSFSFGLDCGHETTRKTIKCIFSKNTNYHFISITNNKKKRKQLKIEVYDTQKRLIASNVNGTTLQTEFKFDIVKTGVYDLILTWEKENLCGVVAYGFYRKSE